MKLIAGKKPATTKSLIFNKAQYQTKGILIANGTRTACSEEFRTPPRGGAARQRLRPPDRRHPCRPAVAVPRAHAERALRRGAERAQRAVAPAARIVRPVQGGSRGHARGASGRGTCAKPQRPLRAGRALLLPRRKGAQAGLLSSRRRLRLRVS